MVQTLHMFIVDIWVEGRKTGVYVRNELYTEPVEKLFWIQWILGNHRLSSGKTVQRFIGHWKLLCFQLKLINWFVILRTFLYLIDLLKCEILITLVYLPDGDSMSLQHFKGNTSKGPLCRREELSWPAGVWGPLPSCRSRVSQVSLISGSRGRQKAENEAVKMRPRKLRGVCRSCQSNRGDLWVQYGTWLLDIGIRWGQGRWRGKGWEAKEVVTWDKQRWVGQRYSAELDHSGFKAIVRTDKICCCSFNTFVV